MAEIPTIPGSARVPDVQIGAKRNVQPRLQALAGVRQASASATGAVQDVLGQVADYEEKKRKAEETYTFNMASLGLQKLHTEYLHNAKAMPDEQIVPGWTQAASEYKSSTINQYGPKLSPRAKQLLSMQMDQGIGEMTAKFQVLSDQFASERRKSAAVANFHEFLKSGDPAMLPKATASLDLAVKARDMTPEERNQYVDQGPAILQENQARNGIQADAQKTLGKIDEGAYDKVPENTLLSLRRQAEVRVATNRKAKYNELRTAQDKGKIYTKKELTEMAERKEIEGSSVKSILDAQGGQIAPEDIKRNLSEVRDMIQKIPVDESEDDRMIQTSEIMSSEAYQNLPNHIKGAMDQELKTGKTNLPPLHHTQAEMMRQTFEQVGTLVPTRNQNIRAAPFIEGGLKKLETMSQADFNAAFRHQGTRQQILQREARREEAARDWYADAQTQYYNFARSKAGQQAKPAEAEAERVRLGFGTYGTVQDLVRDFQAGKIDAATCKKVGFIRFGIE